RGQSVGVYPIQSATPEAIIAELEKIMESGEGGLNQSNVKFQPIARLNAVLVVTRQPNLLRVASTWITRLDKSNTAGAGVRVIRLRFGDAKVIAGLLNDIFGTRAAGGLESAVSQIAPGAGVSATSSTDALAPPGGAAPRGSTLDMGAGLAQVGRSLGVGTTGGAGGAGAAAPGRPHLAPPLLHTPAPGSFRLR